MSIIAKKNLNIATGNVTLSQDSGTSSERLNGSNDQCFVLIESDTAPSAGTFDCYVEYSEGTGFFGVTPIGGTGTSIDATKVGASVADGAVEGWSFNGAPYRVRVTAAGVTGVTDVAVIVRQN